MKLHISVKDLVTNLSFNSTSPFYDLVLENQEINDYQN